MADPSTCLSLTRDSILLAHDLIKPHIHQTPVLTNRSLNNLASTPRSPTSAHPKIRLWFKCENFQRIGAFKARGAFHAIERLKQEPGWLDNGGLERGVVTHSSGNHAQALALAAKENGIRAYIIMPETSNPLKVAATRGYGADVIFSGPSSGERMKVAEEVLGRTGGRMVPPYDHPDIVLGQGTLGLEFQGQVERLMADADADAAVEPSSSGFIRGKNTTIERSSSKGKGLNAIITPCGGGGMLSGVALSCENTSIRVFGAEPSFQGADDCKRGYEMGKRVEEVHSATIADGLRTPVGEVPWSVIYERRLVAGMYSVGEEEIKEAMRLVLERFKLVVEPSACVPLAVVLFDEGFRRMVEREGGEEGWDVGVVFSGGNVGVEAIGKLYT